MRETPNPQPSEQSLALVGQTVTWQGNRRRGGPDETCEVVVQAAEKTFSTISRSDGTLWTGVRYKVKPTDGRRAFWTPTMPDVQIGAPS